MLSLSLSGDDALDARLDAYAGALGDAFAAKAEALAQALADTVKSDKLSGQVLAARSGALRDSIEAEVAADGDSIVATIASVGDVKYAAIQEYGGRTAAHEILPVKGKVLAFLAGGAMRFATRVEHPGSTIPERSYLRATLDEQADAIVAALAATPQETWGAT
jgi:phage gpG-like protein